jgi:two-component system phosphate regulon response regulator PhoB
MSNINVLVVEDEAASREMVVMVLEHAGMHTCPAADVRQAEEVLRSRDPDLILLEWSLPGVNGIEWTRRIKADESYGHLPIVMLTARNSVEDRLQALDAGVDDYITKPFFPKELVARLAAVMRRSGKYLGSGVLKAGKLTLKEDEHRVLIAGSSVDISPSEFRLLSFFMSHPGKAYTRMQILQAVWPRNRSIEERTVDVHIRRLRKILEDHQCEDLIQTVRSVGYRFCPPADTL